MAEKKTFKNVSSVINTFDPEHTWVVEGFRMKSNEFTHREWDMEVTFTKKQKPFEPGDRVRVREMWYNTECTVLVVHKDQVVTVDEGDGIEVYDAEDLEHVG